MKKWVLFTIIIFFVILSCCFLLNVIPSNSVNKIREQQSPSSPSRLIFECLDSPFKNDNDKAVMIISSSSSSTRRLSYSKHRNQRELTIKHCCSSSAKNFSDDSFLKSCGWNSDHDAGQNGESLLTTMINPLFTKVYKTNSQWLRFSSLKEENCNLLEFSSNKQQKQKEGSLLKVHVLYRTLHHPFHLYHSILGPFGLFQLFSVKEQFLAKKSSSPKFKFKFKMIHNDDLIVKNTNDRHTQTTTTTRSLLVKELYRFVLDGEVAEFLDDRKDDENNNEADILIYGGFGHDDVIAGKLFSDSEMENDEDEDKNKIKMIRKFAEKMRKGARKRVFGDHHHQSSNGRTNQNSVLLDHRPFCFEEGVGPQPRFRGLRPAFEQELVEYFLQQQQQQQNTILLHHQHHQQAVVSQLKSALTNNIFILSEGAGVALHQLLAPPNSTIIMIYDHWSTIPSLLMRHPAYHTKLAGVLGHRMIVITLFRLWSEEEVRNFFREHVKQVLDNLLMMTNKTKRSQQQQQQKLQFIGSQDVFYDEKRKKWMNPNGRQNYSIEFSHQNQEDLMTIRKKALKVAGNRLC